MFRSSHNSATGYTPGEEEAVRAQAKASHPGGEWFQHIGSRSSSLKTSSEGSTGESTGAAGSRGSSVAVSGSTVGRTEAVSYGTGTTKVITIPQGQLFSGRTSGGATRSAIYGNR